MRHLRFDRYIVVTLIATAGCAPAEKLAGQQAVWPVLSGTPSTRADVMGVFIDPPLTGVGFCTGFRVSANVVLTARHCVSEMNQSGAVCADETVQGVAYTATRALPPVAASRFTLIDEADALAATEALEAVAVHVPPQAMGQPNCGFDLAAIELQAPRTGPVIAVRATPATQAEEFTAVGYGFNGSAPDSDGVRRARSGLSILTVGETRTTSGRLAATANDWVAVEGPCGGDSGGPALDENGFAIGVMSRGHPTKCQQMIYTQVAPFRPWVRQIVRDAAGRAGIAVAAWADETVDAGSPAPGDAGPAMEHSVTDEQDAGAMQPQEQTMGCAAAGAVGLAPAGWFVLLIAFWRHAAFIARARVKTTRVQR